MTSQEGKKYRDVFLSRLKADIFVKNTMMNHIGFQDSITIACDHIIESLKRGGKILFAGNGGSAADAQHLAGEFLGKFYLEREPIPSVCLNTNMSVISAIANDYDFDTIFSRQIKALGKEGDIFVGISTSGNSKNIINAINEAKVMGACTIGLTGAGGGLVKEVADILIDVPSYDTPRIQESHIMIGHIICEIAEKALWNKSFEKTIAMKNMGTLS